MVTNSITHVTGIEIAVTKEAKMKVAAYVRVSTEDQAREDRFGLADQKESIQRYCEEKGFVLVGIFQDVESGALEQRPGLTALMDRARAGEFEKLIVPKLDRLSRDTLYCLWIEKELKKLDVELVSVAEPYRWDDPIQKLMLTIVAAFSEFERSVITQRLSGGRKAKARQGGYAGGGPAIGYRATRGKKVLDLDTAKTTTVRRVFELRTEYPGWTLQAIADQLNREGHTTAQGARFQKVQVKRILDRRTLYRGGYVYSGIEAGQGQQTAIL